MRVYKFESALEPILQNEAKAELQRMGYTTNDNMGIVGARDDMYWPASIQKMDEKIVLRNVDGVMREGIEMRFNINNCKADFIYLLNEIRKNNEK